MFGIAGVEWYVWGFSAVLLLIFLTAVAVDTARRRRSRVGAHEARVKELLSRLGPPRGPCLLHCATMPYRPIIRIAGNQDEITRLVNDHLGPLSREMQGDRLGSFMIGDRRVGFGLVKTRRDSDEIFLEIMKADGRSDPDELQLLVRVSEMLRHHLGERLQLLERRI